MWKGWRSYDTLDSWTHNQKKQILIVQQSHWIGSPIDWNKELNVSQWTVGLAVLVIMSSNVCRKLYLVKVQKLSGTVLTRVFWRVSSKHRRAAVGSYVNWWYVLKIVQSMWNLHNWGHIELATMVDGLAASIFIMFSGFFSVLTEPLNVVSMGFVVLLVLRSVLIDWTW